MYQYQLTFGQAVSRALGPNYCKFTSRASRSEYWWFSLFTFLISLVFSFLSLITKQATVVTIAMYAVSLYLLLPGLGLFFRRMHDTGRSGWWWLIGLIPLVGEIILLIFLVQPSQESENQYGPEPNMTQG